MNRDHLATTIAMFALTAGALQTGAFAVAGWLAFGTVACAAYGLAFAWLEDRPMTVEAIGALDAAVTEALRETNTLLAEQSKRIGHLQTYLSAAQTATRGSAMNSLRSPIRPPGGAL